MTDQEILDNAPKCATHVNALGTTLFRDKADDIRSLADIKRIVELEKENASLDAQNKRVCSEIAELEKERVVSDLEVEIKALELALAFISDPDLIYNKCKESKIKLKALKEQGE